MKIMNWTLRFILLVSLLGILLLAGCMVAKSTYDTTKADYDALKVEHETLQADYDTLNISYEDLYNSCNELVKAGEDVLDILNKFPPGDFNSLTELENFVRANLQPLGSTDGENFRAALRVQEQGFLEGYAISIMYDPDESDPANNMILNSALMNGTLYVWFPSQAKVYDDYSHLTR